MNNLLMHVEEYDKETGGLILSFEYDDKKYGIIKTKGKIYYPYTIADSIPEAFFHIARSVYGEIENIILEKDRFEKIDMDEMKKLEGETFFFNHEDIFK